LIIEAVFETMAIKKEVFCGAPTSSQKPGAVLASNTSYLNIDEIAKETKRPQDVLGMHFFSPANVMKLCEIVRAAKDRAGCADDRGGGGAQNRKGAGSGSASLRRPLLAIGCSPSAASRPKSSCSKAHCRNRSMAVVTKFGMPMGPFAMGRSRRPRYRLALTQGSRHQNRKSPMRAVRGRTFLGQKNRQRLLQI